MSKKQKFWGLGLLLLAVATFVVVFVLVKPVINPASSPTPSPSSSATITVSEAQTISENSTNLFMQGVMENAKTQLGEDTVKEIQVVPSTDDQTSNGTPAAVTLVKLYPLPSTFDVEQNIEHFESTLKGTNAGNNSDWVVRRVDQEYLDTQSNIINMIQIYQDTDSPTNPAVIEISYLKETDNTISVYVTSTVFI